jgi:hypothetical protein
VLLTASSKLSCVSISSFFQLCDNAMVEAFGLAAEIITCGPEAVKTCLATLRRRQENANLGLEVNL